MDFPFVEYAKVIDLEDPWENIKKVDVKFTQKDGVEHDITFDLGELKCIKKMGQRRRTVMKMEESMREMVINIRAMREDIEINSLT
jgi:hypothetical protein